MNTSDTTQTASAQPTERKYPMTEIRNHLQRARSEALDLLMHPTWGTRQRRSMVAKAIKIIEQAFKNCT